MNRRRFLKLAGIAATGVVIASYPVFIERYLVQINHYTIPVPDLPESFQGFRIAHLTDLHLGPLVSPGFIEGIVKKTNRIKPDIIVNTGDSVHTTDTVEEINTVWPILMKLKAKYGVYSVLGNHDHWADTDRSLAWLEKSGQNIRHTCKAIQKGHDKIVIGGAGDLWEDDLNIDNAFSNSSEEDCRILLTHNPDSIDTDFDTSVNLILSGHTHGGQVRVPGMGSPVLPVKNRRYDCGLISTRKGNLFISRGIGWAIYPIRFNCAPEIAVLELV